MPEVKKKIYLAPVAKDLKGTAAYGMCADGGVPDSGDLTNCTDGASAGFGFCTTGDMAFTGCANGSSVGNGPCGLGSYPAEPCTMGSSLS